MSNNLNKIFTSESVSEGHPDKVCDQISDAILDACLAQDPNSRVACECFAGKGFLVISGEITTKAVVNYDEVARNTIRRIGYVDPELGFSADTVAIMVMINKQSPDIALRTGDDIGGAGDQGIMFGYACNETKELMPATLAFSNNIVKRLAELRKIEGSYASKVLRPDAKSQVSIEYDEEGKIKRIDTIVVSTQHSPDYSQEEIYDFVKNVVINDCIPKRLIDENTKFFINPSGRFVIGGPMGDTGLTGRKIIVDTYGGRAAHGGGCFCVDGDTEFLTPKGWKKIKDYEPMDKVGQVSSRTVNGKSIFNLEFVKPYVYINVPAKEMKRVSVEELEMVLSVYHDVVTFREADGFVKRNLSDLVSCVESYKECVCEDKDFLGDAAQSISVEYGDIPAILDENMSIKELKEIVSNYSYDYLSIADMKIKQFKTKDGRMYCFTVPSGMLLLRRNNKVFVTGNSGKDSTKVDRSAAYMARYLAKNVVAAGIAEQCEIELAYAIGKVEPVSVYVDTYGTGRVNDNDIAEFIKNNFDLSPSGMIKFLDLRKPQFEQLAAYGHMGREELGVKWEDTSECDKFKTLLK